MENQLLQVNHSVKLGLENFRTLNDKFLSLEMMIGIRNNVRTLHQNKLVNRVEGRAINIAIESLFKDRTLAIESVSSDFTAALNTPDTINALDVKIRALFEEIVDWVKSAIGWLNATFAEFEEVYKSLGEIAVKLNGVANELTNATNVATKVDDPDLAKFFYNSVSGLYSGDTISNKYTEHIQLSSPLICIQFVETIMSDLEALNQQLEDDQGIETLLRKIQLIVSNLLENKLSFLEKEDVTTTQEVKVEKYNYDFAFGQYSLHIDSLSTEDKFTSLLTSVNKADELKPIPEDVVLPILTISQIKDLTNKIQNEILFGNYKNSTKLAEKISGLQNTVNTLLATVMKDQTDNELVDISTLGFIKCLLNAVLVMVVSTYKYDVLVARKILEYSEKSLSLY